jgi:predicted nucleic acid-binding protein
LRSEARLFFEQVLKKEIPRVCSSVEVLQELLHLYLPVKRIDTLEASWTLFESTVDEVWPIRLVDANLARSLVGGFESLGARDLLHLACCINHKATQVKTFDRHLESAFAKANSST